MNIVPDIIKPIRLVRGSHADIAATGKGCFMNVVAYLNGDSVITDESPCVCESVKEVAIALNDMTGDFRRGQLLPFVLRAIGSATEDKAIFEERLYLGLKLNHEAGYLLDKYREKFIKISSLDDMRSYNNVRFLIQQFTKAWRYAASQQVFKNLDLLNIQRIVLAEELISDIFKLGIEFLDKALPPAETPDSKILARARQLCDLST